MKKSEFYFILAATLIIVFLLSLIWEFWFEDVICIQIFKGYESETLENRWEYVITTTCFAFISLMISAVAGHKLIIKQQMLTDKIKRASEEDYLTGLYNRRKICEVLDTEIKRCKRYHGNFSIILLDIDYFKRINDTLGHNLGDQFLIEISMLIKQTIRESDIAGRWGGEEFIIICPETNIDGALSLAEKLRINMENKQFKGIGRKTASFGVAGFKKVETLQTIVSRADEALYSAKRAGRNAVKVAH